jgi:hypothetical protein
LLAYSRTQVKVGIALDTDITGASLFAVNVSGRGGIGRRERTVTIGNIITGIAGKTTAIIHVISLAIRIQSHALLIGGIIEIPGIALRTPSG